MIIFVSCWDRWNNGVSNHRLYFGTFKTSGTILWLTLNLNQYTTDIHLSAFFQEHLTDFVDSMSVQCPIWLLPDDFKELEVGLTVKLPKSFLSYIHHTVIHLILKSSKCTSRCFPTKILYSFLVSHNLTTLTTTKMWDKPLHLPAFS
jgi:hypothetical protein